MDVRITKDMLVSDVIALDKNLAGVFAHGLHCLGCVMAHHESWSKPVKYTGSRLTSLWDLNTYLEKVISNFVAAMRKPVRRITPKKLFFSLMTR